MKTIVLEKPGDFRLTEGPAPGSPAPREALVRIRRVGVCGSDIHAYKGNQPFFTYPRVVGHELGVEIAAVGPNEKGLAVGDRCAVEPYLHCGRCIACRRGKTNCCVNLQVLGVHADGGMREFMTVPIAKLHRSRRLSLDQLALVEMLTIGAHAARRAQLDPGENVLVIGAGPIGLATTTFAQLSGARVSVLEISAWRREFCRQHLRVDRCLDGQGDTGKQLQELLDGDLPTTVFDATGSPKSMMQAVQYVPTAGSWCTSPWCRRTSRSPTRRCTAASWPCFAAGMPWPLTSCGPCRWWRTDASTSARGSRTGRPRTRWSASSRPG